METPQIWAHRGAPLGSGELPPENSLKAFRRAINTGADALEFDIQLTRDGQFVVHHDLHLEHPRLGRVAVPDLNVNEIKEMTLDGTGEGIPTLTEVVEEFQTDDVPFIPELKCPDEALARGLDPVKRLCEALDELELSDRVVIQCFYRDALDQLRECRPSLELLALYRHDELVNFDRIPGKAQYLGLPMLSVFFFGRKVVDKAHAQGLKLVPWRDMSLSENAEVFQRLAEFKVDAVMVDDAERALVHYGRIPSPPGFERMERILMGSEEPADSRRSRKPD